MKTVTWILIANGTQARVVEYNGPSKGLTTIGELDWSIEPLQAQDINTDKEGKGKTSDKSPAQLREADFIKEVATRLDKRALNGEYQRLVIAAAPIALGNLRKAMSEHVKKTIIAELDKDLTNIPTGQLGKHFDGIIPV
jgi:protein required for attachment to host cells